LYTSTGINILEVKTVKVETKLDDTLEKHLIQLLKENVHKFERLASKMLGYLDFLCHILTIDPHFKPIIQRRRVFAKKEKICG